jgi:hypothetical protein
MTPKLAESAPPAPDVAGFFGYRPEEPVKSSAASLEVCRKR